MEKFWSDEPGSPKPKCWEEDPERFFPEGNKLSEKIKEAKEVCNTCGFTTECLEAALKNNEAFGIWGGMTPEERDALKRRQARMR